MYLVALAGERIQLTDDIAIVILEVCGGKVRIGIEAPEDVSILRSELLLDMKNDESQ
jgi:carbon storage regulator